MFYRGYIEKFLLSDWFNHTESTLNPEENSLEKVKNSIEIKPEI